MGRTQARTRPSGPPSYRSRSESGCPPSYSSYDEPRSPRRALTRDDSRGILNSKQPSWAEGMSVDKYKKKASADGLDERSAPGMADAMAAWGRVDDLGHRNCCTQPFFFFFRSAPLTNVLCACYSVKCGEVHDAVEASAAVKWDDARNGPPADPKNEVAEQMKKNYLRLEVASIFTPLKVVRLVMKVLPCLQSPYDKDYYMRMKDLRTDYDRSQQRGRSKSRRR